MKNRRYAWIFALLLWHGTAAAQKIEFNHLSIEEGLSSRTVFSLQKDAEGFLWIATDVGVDRYDGRIFKHYPFQGHERKYLLRNATGEIFAALTNGKIYKYDDSQDHFVSFLDVKQQIDPQTTLLTASFDRADNLLLGTNTGLFTTHDGRQIIRNERLPVCRISNIVQTDSSLYVFTPVSNYRMTKDEVREFSVPALPKRHRVQTSLYDPVTNRLYLGTFEHGLVTLDATTGEEIKKIRQIPSLPIRSIRIYQDRYLLVGIDGAGIYSLDRYDNSLCQILHSDPDKPYSISSDGIYDIFIDPENILWVATYAAGLNYYDLSSLEYNVIRHKYQDNNSLVNNHINTVFEDSDGDIWFGTNKGVSMQNSRSGAWRHYLHGGQSPADNRPIMTINEGRDGTIWAGGYTTGAILIDKDRGTLRMLRKTANPETGPSTNSIFTIFRDSKDRMWLGGISGPLSCFDPDSDKFTVFKLDQVFSIAEKRPGELYLGTPSGLYTLNTYTNLISKVIIPEQTLPQNDFKINCLSSNNGMLWIGTEKWGVIGRNIQTGEITVYDKRHGLRSQNISTIVPESQDRIWVTTGTELALINTSNGKVWSFNGLGNTPAKYFNDRSGVLLQNGKITLGTAWGALVFNPSEVSPPTSQTSLYFSDFKLSYRTVTPDNENGILKHAINKTAELHLPHNKNTFSFGLGAISFNRERDILFSWKLEGFDDEWMAPTTLTTAGYTNIAPGNYLFRVRAVDTDGLTTLNERQIRINIKPPFWNTTWAWIIYVLVTGIILYFLFRFYTQRLEMRHSKEKISFFINASHDIRTPLTLIKAPLNDIEQAPELSPRTRRYLRTAISNTDRMLEFINQLLDFEQHDMNKIHLLVSEYSLNGYIREHAAHFDNLARHHEIELKIVPAEPDITVWFDKSKMDKIMDNLLSNALKYTENGGQVTIELNADANQWQIRIIDTGIGIPRSEQRKIFRYFFRAENAVNTKKMGSGIGLMLTKKLVEMHGGHISFESRQAEGTTFTLNFPTGTSVFAENQIARYMLHEPEPDRPSPSERSERPGNLPHARILVVEDNNELRSYLCDSLASLYQISGVATAEKALLSIRQSQPDLILSDIMMPGMSGEQFCKMIKTDIAISHIPVILITALSGKTHMLRGLKTGADDYITKPFEIDVLRVKIENILTNRRKLKEYYVHPNPGMPSEEIEMLPSLDKEFLAKVIEAIQNQIGNPELSVVSLVMQIGMGRTVFYNKLKALTGQSPNEFIRTQRMHKAMQLLLEQRYTINEISDMVGFADSKYFSTTFRKFFGKSPSKYLLENDEQMH